MNVKMICRVLGYVTLIVAALMLLPMLAGVCYGENISAFAVTVGIAAAVGGALLLPKPANSVLYARDGFTVVGLSWIVMSLLGALPFVLNGDIPNYIDALFETVSGFTTTGASVVTNVEAMSRAGLFWRLFTHWIGGMGVLVFMLAVMPMSGEHSMHIMRAEIPGPTVGKLVPRARKTAVILYLIYIGLTVAEAILLLCGGMSFYDAVLHAFASAGTGGFSTMSASIAGFDSVYIEMVVAVFLVLFGTNFNLYYLILMKKWRAALKSEELHTYIGILVAATAIIALNITHIYGSFFTSLRHAFFNVASISSTAGFGTEDFTLWPAVSQSVLVALMLIGGCAGSTGGGLKLARVMMLLKTAFMDVKKIIYPRSVDTVRMDGARVDDGTVRASYTYFTLYMLLLIFTSLCISVDGYDVLTNFTAAVSCLSNIGPGLGLIGPSGSFSIFSGFSKVIMSAAMLLGRLEIYPIMVLFFPHLWRNRLHR